MPRARDRPAGCRVLPAVAGGHSSPLRAPNATTLARLPSPPLVMRTWVPPALGTVQIWLLPERVLANAIRVPSADHVGLTSIAALVVRRLTVPSSRFLTKMYQFPLTLRLKAIRLPSGEKAG